MSDLNHLYEADKWRIEELEGALMEARRALMADLPEDAIDAIDEVLEGGGE